LKSWRNVAAIQSNPVLGLNGADLWACFYHCFAFPVHDDTGDVVAVHYRLKDRSWRYYPQGTKVRPLVIGELVAGDPVHAFESYFDAFSFLDKSHERSGIIITRSQNGAYLLDCERCLVNETSCILNHLRITWMLRNSIMRPTWKIWTLFLAAVSIVTMRADSDKSVTADQVNGTWQRKGGEFKIWALDQQRLQIEFSGVYEYKTLQGPSANEGEGSGIATIEGDTAIFKPEGAEEECRITLKFNGGKLVVTQTGICGFGLNVSAEGTYKRVSTKKPKFESD
jgi:hypothetical protein